MNQDNWEKSKSEKAKEFEKKYLDGTNESHWAACLDGFDAGADFGRAYSQGEVEFMNLTLALKNMDDTYDKIDELVREIADLRHEILRLMQPKGDE